MPFVLLVVVESLGKYCGPGIFPTATGHTPLLRRSRAHGGQVGACSARACRTHERILQSTFYNHEECDLPGEPLNAESFTCVGASLLVALFAGKGVPQRLRPSYTNRLKKKGVKARNEEYTGGNGAVLTDLTPWNILCAGAVESEGKPLIIILHY